MVYLLHAKRALHHAQHYLGSTDDLVARVSAHANGTSGARLPEVFHELGIELVLARTWSGGREKERELKRQHNGRRLCPLCNPPKKKQKKMSP
jgi:predicted GIY-YIG superfamily endonuclease